MDVHNSLRSFKFNIIYFSFSSISLRSQTIIKNAHVGLETTKFTLMSITRGFFLYFFLKTSLNGNRLIHFHIPEVMWYLINYKGTKHTWISPDFGCPSVTVLPLPNISPYNLFLLKYQLTNLKVKTSEVWIIW